MTQDSFPITPPPDLVEQWECEYRHMTFCSVGPDMSMFLTEKAARWGADRQLEQCVDWVNEYESNWLNGYEREGPAAEQMRNACRPKPPSLKEQALALIDECTDPHGNYLDDNTLATIRRALESLPS